MENKSLAEVRKKIKQSMISNYYKHNFLPQNKRFKVNSDEYMNNVFKLSEINIDKDRKWSIIRCLPKHIFPEEPAPTDILDSNLTEAAVSEVSNKTPSYKLTIN